MFIYQSASKSVYHLFFTQTCQLTPGFFDKLLHPFSTYSTKVFVREKLEIETCLNVNMLQNTEHVQRAAPVGQLLGALEDVARVRSLIYRDEIAHLFCSERIVAE